MPVSKYKVTSNDRPDLLVRGSKCQKADIGCWPGGREIKVILHNDPHNLVTATQGVACPRKDYHYLISRLYDEVRI